MKGDGDRPTIRLGTRGSALARWQAEWVRSRLEERGNRVELVLIETMGDVRSGPIGQLPSQGVFTKEIQRALLRNEIDLAVHSLKDLPTEPVEGLALAAIPPREVTGDALITAKGESFDRLPPGARIGTGSARRKAQLAALRPDLVLLEIRGNVDTRLRKLDEGEYDAIVLAEAGLRRLGWGDRITQVFSVDQMLPAVGQGALGLEVRSKETGPAEQAVWDIVRQLNDDSSELAVVAERSMLANLRGGCLAPVGAWCRRNDQELLLDGLVMSVDGRQHQRASRRTTLNGDEAARLMAAQKLGQSVAETLLSRGAADLIEASRLRQ